MGLRADWKWQKKICEFGGRLIEIIQIEKKEENKVEEKSTEPHSTVGH